MLRAARTSFAAVGILASSVMVMQSRAQTTSTVCAAATPAYEQLKDKLREIEHLSGICGLLGWDESTMMPPGAEKSRGNQKSVLSKVIYPFSFSRVRPPILDALFHEKALR